MNAVDLYTQDRLVEILKPYDWEDLEDTISGNRKFGQVFYFHLRVGFFMKRPMRVVMACGKYVWMKEEKTYVPYYDLKALDPAHPDKNLYSTGTPDKALGWRPVLLYTSNTGFMNVASSMSFGGLSNAIPVAGATYSSNTAAITQQQLLQSQYNTALQNHYTTTGLGHAPSLPRVK